MSNSAELQLKEAQRQLAEFARDVKDRVQLAALSHADEIARLESRLKSLQGALEKWKRRIDRGFDPDEPEETTAFWNGARRVVEELSVLSENPSASAEIQSDETGKVTNGA